MFTRHEEWLSLFAKGAEEIRRSQKRFDRKCRGTADISTVTACSGRCPLPGFGKRLERAEAKKRDTINMPKEFIRKKNCARQTRYPIRYTCRKGLRTHLIRQRFKRTHITALRTACFPAIASF
ncbi:hypothetical protein Bbelb_092520 [Branchiostoma belcheri]|nr:hypothetical protein Bbelb_092520 [Branchiostoma belcheri]